MTRISVAARQNRSTKALGKVIRSKRLEQQLSQEAFADLVGLDRSYVGGIERGEHNISIHNLLKIAAGLNTSLTKLFSEAKL